MKTCPCLTERLLMGRKESKQTNKSTKMHRYGIPRPIWQQIGSKTLTKTTKLGVILLNESQQRFWSQSLWNTNDKNGFQSFLNAWDFSVERWNWSEIFSIVFLGKCQEFVLRAIPSDFKHDCLWRRKFHCHLDIWGSNCAKFDDPIKNA